MTENTPIWLLDVDGVIIQIRRPSLPDVDVRTFRSANGYQITYRIALLERMARLHAEGKVEIQWLTTWEELADAYLAEELGLPRGLKVAGTHRGDGAGESYWWKENATRRIYATGRRIIWTDDDIAHSGSTYWLNEDADPEQIIWLSPDESYGITDEFMDKVEMWL